ncbi:hypothetical protein AND_009241 [Anopheles darlingi]|uniref:Ig-like domain-containing protein n=1 Tax=Anopheles darlingi TaxID=43151 RepID=W5J594_ANODA|nr:hypothetical protein AND_009241 [Anopheles darlingi]
MQQMSMRVNQQLNSLHCGLLNIISGEVQSYWEQPFAQPYFDNSTKREVTATVGQSALLHCRVRNLGDRAVSWIRKRDLHILTVGILTYTNDQRFQSLHTEGSDEWTLRITSPQPRDSGTYECQVSTEPKISQAFRLNVVGFSVVPGGHYGGQSACLHIPTRNVHIMGSSVSLRASS